MRQLPNICGPSSVTTSRLSVSVSTSLSPVLSVSSVSLSPVSVLSVSVCVNFTFANSHSGRQKANKQLFTISSPSSEWAADWVKTMEEGSKHNSIVKGKKKQCSQWLLLKSLKQEGDSCDSIAGLGSS